MMAADRWPPPDEGAVSGRAPRRVILATCLTHGGTRGFTNVVLTKQDSTITIDPHATGACVLVFVEDAATTLRDTLTEWLG